MGLQVVNKQSQVSNSQNTSGDSLGVISLQSSIVQSQGIVYPYALTTPIVNNDSIAQQTLSPNTKLDLPTNSQTIQFPYAVTNSAETLNFSVSMFEYGDSIDFTHTLYKAEKQEFTEQLQEKVFVINYKKINDTTNNWMFWFILGALVLFGWSRLFYKKQLDLLMSSILHYNFAMKSIRNTSDNSQRFSNILQLIFSVNIALFSFQIFNFYNSTNIMGIKAIGIVTAISIAFLLVYGVKDIFYKFLGYIFKESGFSFEYLFNVHLYNRVLGIFLFPIIISLAFVQNHIIDHKLILYAGILLILTFFIFRIIRGIQISIKANVSILYMFLYFCTLEILPIAVLAKVGTIVLHKF